MSRNQLEILNWNARDVQLHAHELCQFLKDRKIGIACLTRNSKRIFQIQRINRYSGNSRLGGGVAILVKNIFYPNQSSTQMSR